MSLRFKRRDLFRAWLVATVFSGLPSTLYALGTGGDPLEATRAAGTMLIAPDRGLAALVLAAGAVHAVVSAFWAGIFALLLPRRRVASWAMAGAAAVAVLDLGIIAPRFFPSVAALDFWPQFADHLTWGLLLGATLGYCEARRS